MWIRDSALHRARALLSLLLDPFLVVVVEGSRKQEMHEEEEEGGGDGGGCGFSLPVSPRRVIVIENITGSVLVPLYCDDDGGCMQPLMSL